MIYIYKLKIYNEITQLKKWNYLDIFWYISNTFIVQYKSLSQVKNPDHLFFELHLEFL